MIHNDFPTNIPVSTIQNGVGANFPTGLTFPKRQTFSSRHDIGDDSRSTNHFNHRLHHPCHAEKYCIGSVSSKPASQRPIKEFASEWNSSRPKENLSSPIRDSDVPLLRKRFLSYNVLKSVRRSFNLCLIYFAQTQRPRAKSLKQTDCDLCVYATRISSVCSGFFIRLLV